MEAARSKEIQESVESLGECWLVFQLESSEVFSMEVWVLGE
jgi:hypothetical protein